MLITLLTGSKLIGTTDIFENREITQRLEILVEIITMRFDLGKIQIMATGRETIRNAK